MCIKESDGVTYFSVFDFTVKGSSEKHAVKGINLPT